MASLIIIFFLNQYFKGIVWVRKIGDSYILLILTLFFVMFDVHVSIHIPYKVFLISGGGRGGGLCRVL